MDLYKTDFLESIGWKGGPHFFSHPQQGRHPALGLRVTISGRHPMSGLHGVVHETYDHLSPPKFAVEVEVTRALKLIEAQYLSYRQYVNSLYIHTYIHLFPRGEPHNEWASQHFMAQKPRAESSKLVPIPPSLPLVPSTPLPPQVVFGGTPAWDPSSRTPVPEPDSPPTPRHLLIQKPPGKLNRSNGYYLQSALNLGGDLYAEIDVGVYTFFESVTQFVQMYIRKLADDHLDLRKSLTSQSPSARDTVMDEVTISYLLVSLI